MDDRPAPVAGLRPLVAFLIRFDAADPPRAVPQYWGRLLLSTPILDVDGITWLWPRPGLDTTPELLGLS